jgi:hypothetical protein
MLGHEIWVIVESKALMVDTVGAFLMGIDFDLVEPDIKLHGQHQHDKGQPSV